MSLTLYIKYLFKFYSQNKLRLLVSVICLTICFLAVEIVLSFASIIEHNSQQTFNRVFKDGSFILTSTKGIKFEDNGKLSKLPVLDSISTVYFINHITGKNYSTIQLDSSLANTSQPNFVVVFDKSLGSDLKAFCDKANIKLLNSFYTDTVSTNYKAILYDVNGTGNRFSFFSFKNQISAFILGSELSSGIGLVSRLLFIISVVFTLYISLLYFNERKNEFGTLIIEGHTDRSLRIIFIDCVIQNLLSFITSIFVLVVIMYSLTDNNNELRKTFQSLLYILPYLPVMIILQMLLLLNRTINYAASFK